MTLLTLTPEAWRFVLRPSLGEGRVLVVGRRPSGCAGFRYMVRRTQTVPEGHVSQAVPLPEGPAWVAMLPDDVPHLQGTEVSLVQEGLNRVLAWANPQEVARCGCGLSVATATANGPAPASP